MTQFHQEHQQVFGQQQNAGNDITNTNQSLTFGAVQSPADLSALLAQLQSAVTQATADGTLPEEMGTSTCCEARSGGHTTHDASHHAKNAPSPSCATLKCPCKNPLYAIYFFVAHTFGYKSGWLAISERTALPERRKAPAVARGLASRLRVGPIGQRKLQYFAYMSPEDWLLA